MNPQAFSFAKTWPKMAKGPCGGCRRGNYLGRGKCTNRRCRDPHGPGRRDHPLHRRRSRTRSPTPPRELPLPTPSALCVVCMARPPQVRLQPCRCAALCRHCAAVLFATHDNPDALPRCPTCRGQMSGFASFVWHL